MEGGAPRGKASQACAEGRHSAFGVARIVKRVSADDPTWSDELGAGGKGPADVGGKEPERPVLNVQKQASIAIGEIIRIVNSIFWGFTSPRLVVHRTACPVQAVSSPFLPNPVFQSTQKANISQKSRHGCCRLANGPLHAGWQQQRKREPSACKLSLLRHQLHANLSIETTQKS